MPGFNCGSGVTGWIDFNNARLSGNWPNIVCYYDVVCRWTSQWGHSQQWNGASAWGHTASNSFNANYGMVTNSPSYGIGTFGVGMGNNRYNVFRVGCGANAYFSFSGMVDIGSPTIPNGAISGLINNVTINSANVVVGLHSPYNYWFARVRLNGKLISDRGAGNQALSGLIPNTNYTVTIECVGRNGAGIGTGTYTFKTLEDQKTLYVKVANIWRRGKLFVKHLNQWKKAKQVYVKVNGIWKKVP